MGGISVVDAPCFLGEVGGDNFGDPDYDTCCSDCEDDGECAERGCSHSCHFDIEPEEPEDDDALD